MKILLTFFELEPFRHSVEANNEVRGFDGRWQSYMIACSDMCSCEGGAGSTTEPRGRKGLTKQTVLRSYVYSGKILRAMRCYSTVCHVPCVNMFAGTEL
jgi:hypothetical protein